MKPIIKIDTKVVTVPVEIGSHEFEFSVSDDAIDRVRAEMAALQEKLKKITPEKGDETKAAKQVLREGYDTLLGEGAFDKIYDETPSVMYVAQYFMQLVEGITDHLEKTQGQSQAQIAQKYLKERKE